MSLYPSLEALTIGKILSNQENKSDVVALINPQRSGTDYNLLARNILGIDLDKISYDEFGNACYCDSSNSRAVIRSTTNALSTLESDAIALRDHVQVSQQVREIIVRKSAKGFLGVQLRNQDAGIFVTYVEHDSPAAKAGLRFGDQILKVNEKYVAGMKGKEVMKFISKKCGLSVSIVIRDRPLERAVYLMKDSLGSVGLVINEGAVESIVKGSSAERNGVLIKSQICEINGVNVLGMSDDTIRELIKMSGIEVKVTLIPEFFFKNLTKKLGKSHLKDMDRSLPII